jgi:tetratricopeptide (TPR) repeat protein
MRTAAQYYEDSLNARELAKTKQISDAATQEAEMGLQYEEWSLRSALAQIYFELGEKQRALPHAKAALQTAPDTERARLQQLVEALQTN